MKLYSAEHCYHNFCAHNHVLVWLCCLLVWISVSKCAIFWISLFLSDFLFTATNMKIPGIATERLSSIFSKQTRLMQSTDAFNVKAIYNETKDLNRIAIITGKKKIGKSAVHRNRADRRIKSALQTVYPNLKMKGRKERWHCGMYLILSLLARLWFSVLFQTTRHHHTLDYIGRPSEGLYGYTWKESSKEKIGDETIAVINNELRTHFVIDIGTRHGPAQKEKRKKSIWGCKLCDCF